MKGHGGIGSALIVAALLAANPASAQSSTRIPVPPEAITAFDRGEYGKAAEVVGPAFDTCRLGPARGDACADLAITMAMIVAMAGNAKTEPIILAALAYIDERVGPESREALGVVSALASYYDRLTLMDRILPVAQRRLALARKQFGPTHRTAVTAAVALCVAQWNLGQGQAAVDLLTPLAGQLPTGTADEAMLAGRVNECLGTALYAIERDRDAEPAFRKAVALFGRGEGRAGERTLDATASLASTLRRLGRVDEARILAGEVDRLAKPGSPVRARIAWWSAAPANPVAAAQAELAQAEKQYGASSPVADMAAAALGAALIDAGRLAEGERYVARLSARSADPRVPPAVRIKLLTAQIALYIKQDGTRIDRTLGAMERLIALAKSTDAGSDRLLIDFQMYAGTLLNRVGRPTRAWPYLTDSGRLLLQRIASYRDFDAAAQGETRAYSPVFRYQVATAWALAQTPSR